MTSISEQLMGYIPHLSGILEAPEAIPWEYDGDGLGCFRDLFKGCPELMGLLALFEELFDYIIDRSDANPGPLWLRVQWAAILLQIAGVETETIDEQEATSLDVKASSLETPLSENTPDLDEDSLLMEHAGEHILNSLFGALSPDAVQRIATLRAQARGWE